MGLYDGTPVEVQQAGSGNEFISGNYIAKTVTSNNYYYSLNVTTTFTPKIMFAAIVNNTIPTNTVMTIGIKSTETDNTVIGYTIKTSGTGAPASGNCYSQFTLNGNTVTATLMPSGTTGQTSTVYYCIIG